MTDLDLTRYEGHTEGPWQVNKLPHQTLYTCDTFIEPSVAAVWANGPDAALIADAPLLLAEVRRLRVELDELRDGVEAAGLEYREDDGPASYWRNTPALDAEHELRALRQSHARLLAAAKQVDNWIVPRCICSPGAKCLGCKLRAAVAEAEALNGE